MQEEESIQIIYWVKTGSGIQWKIEGDRRISGESEAAGRKYSKRNAENLTVGYQIT